MKLGRTNKQRILVVDDEPSVRESLERVFQLADYETHTAATGREATDKMAECNAAVVLLDVDMPEENGWETARRFAALCPWVPVLMITGRPGQCVPVDAGNIAGLMEKPLDLPSLLRVVGQLSGRKPDDAQPASGCACEAV